MAPAQARLAALSQPLTRRGVGSGRPRKRPYPAQHRRQVHPLGVGHPGAAEVVDERVVCHHRPLVGHEDRSPRVSEAYALPAATGAGTRKLDEHVGYPILGTYEPHGRPVADVPVDRLRLPTANIEAAGAVAYRAEPLAPLL